ncbi:MAG: hypothetical protein HC896_11135 [Bacteroidales bacterium]|nr:hypothetical protein [Bacteroidales bacterium]
MKLSINKSLKTLWFATIAIFLFQTSHAQDTNRFGIVTDPPPGTLIKSWIGSNLRGLSNQWVQDFINDFYVDQEGIVYTYADWDESHHEKSKYKNGAYIGSHNNPVLNREIRDQGNNLWNIPNKKFLGGDSITKNGVTIDFPNLDKPVGLAIANNGNLMVADIGPDQQVKFYDISSDAPVLVKTFGVKGGALAPGKPKGVIGDDLLRFYGLRSCGMDSAGNIYVGGIHPGAGGGSWIIAFTPEGEPIWRLFGETFITVAAPDPTTDGDIIYGNAIEYRMDYTREPGMEQGYFPYAVTTDIFEYTHDDKRFNMFDEVDGKSRHMTEASSRAHFNNDPHGIIAVKQIEGRKYLFGTSQNGPGLEAYQFMSESIAKNMPLNGLRNEDGSKFGDDWGYWVDENNDIWIAHEYKPNGIDRFRLQGVDVEGNLIYNNDARDHWPVPADCELNGTHRIMYSAEEDALYITGYSNQNPEDWDQWGAVGTEVWCYDNFTAGTPVKRAGYPIVLMHEANGEGTGAGGITNVNPDESYSAKSIYLAGDYIFVTNITIGPRDGRCEVYIFDKHTGESMGTIIPEDTPNTTRYGWIDIVNGLTAYKRSNGEYVILLEEGARNKNMMYRWCPTGDCVEHDVNITLSQPAQNTYIVNSSAIDMEATVTTDTSTISQVAFYINGEKVAEITEAPYTYTSAVLPIGKYDVKAVATSNGGISKPSFTHFVEIGNGMPEIKIKSPQPGQFYSIVDSIFLMWWHGTRMAASTVLPTTSTTRFSRY